MRRLTIAGLIAALTLEALVTVASAQTNPFGGAPTNPYGGAQTNPYGGAQTNPYGGVQTNPFARPQTRRVVPAVRVPSWWPPILTPPVVKETYSDVPWHQKLGTYAGNEIIQALVLPFGALDPGNVSYCKTVTNPDGSTGLSPARCMIETGINSILSYERTDSTYDWKSSPDAIQTAIRCKSAPSGDTGTCTMDDKPYCIEPAPPSKPNNYPCIEVNLVVSMYWLRSNDSAHKTLTLQQRPYGNELKAGTVIDPGPPPKTVDIYDSGLVYTDGTVYAPQMPWYMSHYCSLSGSVTNTVCDDDYFTTRNSGFSVTSASPGNNSGWPNSNASWSVYPNAILDFVPNGVTNPPPNHCAQRGVKDTQAPALVTCTLVLAGFYLFPMTKDYTMGQFGSNNSQLFDWFNSVLVRFSPTDTNAIFSKEDFQRHFPWSFKTGLNWATDVYPQARSVPFLGQYPTGTGDRSDHFLYPRRCTAQDLAAADIDVAALRNCGLTFEFHPNGWQTQWPNTDFWQGVKRNTTDGILHDKSMLDNQYGRTMFLLAGVPGMQLPVGYYKDPKSSVCVSGTTETCSVYERVHNASLFSLYLPIANEADYKLGENGRAYTDKEFYHTLLMSNHMELDKDTFANGIRGKTLWHNEYRSQTMYDGPATAFPPTCNPTASPAGCLTFPAAFTAGTAPYHNYTCDGCHVRNGSGIPIKPDGTLDKVLQGLEDCIPGTVDGTCYMTNGQYTAYKVPDYTFTGVIKPMKLVFFDLGRPPGSGNNPSKYSNPQNGHPHHGLDQPDNELLRG